MPARPRTSITLIILLFAGAIACTLTGAGSAVAATSLAAPTATYEFRLNKHDKAALRARKRARTVQHKADAARKLMERDDARIARIEELMSEAAGDEATLREAVQARLVEQYKHGTPNGDWSFLLAADGLGDAIDRAALTNATDDQDKRLLAAHKLSLQRLEDLQAALTELRDLHGEQAALYDEQVGELVSQTVTARELHMQEAKKRTKGAGIDGTWYVVNGESQGFMPMLGSLSGAYDGGTRTPARPATQMQVSAVLGDPRIEIYAGGRQDIASGRIDGRLLDALRLLADRFGSVHVTSLMTGHGVYTASGNVSEHSFGCAADIGSLSGIRIEPATQGTGSITEQGAMFLGALTGDLAPHQVISLNSYGGPTLAMGDHGDHIHLGYSC